MRRILLGTMMMVAAAAAAPEAQAQEAWQWRKALPVGRTIEVRNVIGSISALPASGSEVEIVALKTGGRQGAAADVRIVAVETASGATICVQYPTRRAAVGDDDCESGGMSTERNDTRVDFEVRVPRGVRFSGASVSGDVEAEGLTAFAKVSSVSGDVRVSTSDLAEATTVSGSVHARMGRADWNGTLRFSSVSGDVVVELPAQVDADVKATTVSGGITSDWPVTISGEFGPRSMSGTIGRGGRNLALSTVSGSIQLRRH